MHDKLEAMLHSPYFAPAVIGVTGFASGLGLGFVLGKRNSMTAEIHQFPERVLFEPDALETVLPPKVVIDADDAVEQGIITVDSLGDLRPSMVQPGDTITVPDENGGEEEVEVISVEETEDIVVQELIDSEIDWDWETELAQRTETAPYVLHEEEYVENETNFSQHCLTYYVADDVLADEDGAPMNYNVEAVVGPYKFGHGCRADDVFFVRNHERKAEYEINKIEGYWAVEVLGHEFETQAEASDLKHSRDPVRFRGD